MRRLLVYTLILLIGFSLIRTLWLVDEPLKLSTLVAQLSNFKFEFSNMIDTISGFSVNLEVIMDAFSNCSNADFFTAVSSIFLVLVSPIQLIFAVLIDLILIVVNAFQILFILLGIPIGGTPV